MSLAVDKLTTPTTMSREPRGRVMTHHPAKLRPAHALDRDAAIEARATMPRARQKSIADQLRWVNITVTTIDAGRRKTVKVAAVAAGFVATVFIANWLTTRFGFVPVGFGLTATAGTYAAGLSFGIRDALHEVAGRWAVLAAIVVGALVSALVSPSLALASGAAFLVSETADLAVYDPLRRRRWVLAVVLSNLVGAAVDTVLFLHLAGFPIRSAFAGQMAGKALMVLPALALVGWVRRNR